MPKTKKPDEFKNEAGHRLAKAERATGLTARAICDAINCQENTWSQWKSGKSPPELLAMIRFCDKYGMTLDWIYRGVPWGLTAAIAQRIERMTAEQDAKGPKRPEKPEVGPYTVSDS